MVASSIGALLSLGYFYGARTRSQKLRWLFCLLCLPFVAHAVSLAASSQAVGYRTVFGLSGLVLVLVVFALRSVCRDSQAAARRSDNVGVRVAVRARGAVRSPQRVSS